MAGMQLMWSTAWTNTIHSCFWINKTLFKLVYKEFCMLFWMLIWRNAEANSLRSAQVRPNTVIIVTPFWTWALLLFPCSKSWLLVKLLGCRCSASAAQPGSCTYSSDRAKCMFLMKQLTQVPPCWEKQAET